MPPNIDFYIVGSTARGEENPRDLDLRAVMDNGDFYDVYNIVPDNTLFKQIGLDMINRPTTPEYQGWKRENTGARRILEHLFPYRGVDLLIIPRYLFKTDSPYIEVTLDRLCDYR